MSDYMEQAIEDVNNFLGAGLIRMIRGSSESKIRRELVLYIVDQREAYLREHAELENIRAQRDNCSDTIGKISMLLGKKENELERVRAEREQCAQNLIAATGMLAEKAAEIERLRKGLQDIICHHEAINGAVGRNRSLSTTIRIAEKALGGTDAE